MGGDDFRAFGGGMNAVGLNGVGDVDQVFVDHGDKRDMVPGGKVAEDLLEGLDVVGAVVGREGDAGEQNLDVSFFKRGEHLVEIVPGLVRGQSAETVVAAEFNDDDVGVHEHDGIHFGNSVFGGSAAGTLIVYLVVVIEIVEIALKHFGKGLSGVDAVAGGDAVSKADQEGPVGGERRAGE